MSRGGQVGGLNRGDASGLNPDRQKGFGNQVMRVETPSLSEMRARQGAIVAKFMIYVLRMTCVELSGMSSSTLSRCYCLSDLLRINSEIVL